MNIVYVVPSLSIHGGVERILSLKANYLANQKNFNVSIITYDQDDKPIFFNLDKRVNIVNLNIGLPKDSKNLILRKINFHNYSKIFINKINAVNKILRPDFIISMGGIEFFILNQLKDKSFKIAEYHVTMGSFLYYIKKEKNLIKKFRQKISLKNFISNVKSYERFIVLTEGDKQEWLKYSNNIDKIPNFLTMELSGSSDLEAKTAIAVGRFEPEKQFDHLILAWKEVVVKYPDWQLKLKGSGSEEANYNSLIKKYHLENNVFIIPPSKDMKDFYLNSSMYLMASRFEGFSLVVLEAMQAGLPIVSYNCKYGPIELIKDGYNGFLVERDNLEQLTQRVIQVIEDRDLRDRMGVQSLEKSRNYQQDKIMQQWIELFDTLLKNNEK